MVFRNFAVVPFDSQEAALKMQRIPHFRYEEEPFDAADLQTAYSAVEYSVKPDRSSAPEIRLTIMQRRRVGAFKGSSDSPQPSSPRTLARQDG